MSELPASITDSFAERERRVLREMLMEEDMRMMSRLRRVLDEVAFELDPLMVYVIVDKLRGQRNSASVPEEAYARAERLLELLGVNEQVERVKG